MCTTIGSPSTAIPTNGLIELSIEPDSDLSRACGLSPTLDGALGLEELGCGSEGAEFSGPDASFSTAVSSPDLVGS